MKILPNERSALIKKAIINGLKVLVWDVESCHAKARLWGTGEQVVTHEQIIEPPKLITIQYKWADKKNSEYLVCKYVKGKIQDDSLIEDFIKVLNKADISITQNGDRFDFALLRARAKADQLGISLKDIPSIDIQKLSRNSFKSMSHSLDWRSREQGLGGKIKMVRKDWIDIEDRFDQKALKKMIKYGCKDVEDTLQIFWNELLYYKSIPGQIEKLILQYAYGFKYDPKVYCTKCNIGHIIKYGKSPSSKGTMQKYLCTTCGSVTRKEI